MYLYKLYSKLQRHTVASCDNIKISLNENSLVELSTGLLLCKEFCMDKRQHGFSPPFGPVDRLAFS